MDPLVNGEYPKVMQDLVIGGLPKFTPEQKAMVQGSFDFIGLNYYTARYVTPSHISTIDTTYGQCRTEFIEQGGDSLALTISTFLTFTIYMNFNFFICLSPYISCTSM